MQAHVVESELCVGRCIHEERVVQANSNQLPELDIDDLSRLFKTMGDPSRLRILWAVKDAEMCVCDIAAFLKISESAVSHQLRNLKNMKLVTNRRVGAILYYRLNDDHVAQLFQLALEHIHE